MTTCADYRRAVLADPRHPDPTVARHRESCEVCAAYTERLQGFEGRLERALKVNPPARAATAPSAQIVPLRRRALRVRGGWLAMAASVLIALGIVTSLWLAVPHESLAADVVAHMAGEPAAWARTQAPVAPAQLAKALNDAHLELSPSAGLVSYAQSCWFRGHFVPHLVIQTDKGPVTVMVLVHEPAAKPVPFDEGGYRGLIVPDAGHGSLAVLARDPDADAGALQRIAAGVRAALIWKG